MNGWLVLLLVVLALLVGYLTHEDLDQARILRAQRQARDEVYRDIETGLDRINRGEG